MVSMHGVVFFLFALCCAGLPARSVRLSRQPRRLALRVLRGHGAAAGAAVEADAHGDLHPVLLRLRASSQPSHEEQGQRGERSRVLQGLRGAARRVIG